MPFATLKKCDNVLKTLDLLDDEQEVPEVVDTPSVTGQDNHPERQEQPGRGASGGSGRGNVVGSWKLLEEVQDIS